MPIERPLAALRAWRIALLFAPLLVGASGCETGSPAQTADHPLHLEDRLEAATIEGSEVPTDPPEAVEWRFEDGPGDWQVAVPYDPSMAPIEVERVEDGVSLVLTENSVRTLPNGRRRYAGGIYVDLPDWTREDWAFVAIRARTADSIGAVEVAFNLRDRAEAEAEARWFPFRFASEYVDVIDDGAIHTYIMRADWSWGEWEGPWKQLGVWIGGNGPGRLDLLSVSVIPKAASYADSRAGVATEQRAKMYRRVLYMHAPGRIDFPVRVPPGGRLDVDLGVLRDDVPVTFRVEVAQGGADTAIVLEKALSDKEAWHEQSVDLTSWAGQTIDLALRADADQPGTVALWGAPTVSGGRSTDRPNIIFYIIDAGGADYMSVYSYNRRTTPNMERLAEAGAVFENAYSNSTWSKTSTPSFATSLQHSVLGGYKTDSDPIPEQAVTMAQRLHRAGYQTAVLTSNAYAGTMTSMDRGADALRDVGAEPNSTSSAELHEDFWSWREAFPGEPYFVHFQTTDVHYPWKPSAPFAGSFVEPEARERFYEWERQLARAAGLPRPRWLNRRTYADSAYEKTGIDRRAFYNVARGLYDETMAHQDYQLGKLVDRLKATGEWEHTLLIVAADHGNEHGLGVFDSIPRWRPIFDPYATRIPLIIVWPERIAGGQRFRQPVSMIDMLPTILDLVGLPPAEVAMGQSLAPPLLGEQGWEPRPVIFDEFYVDWDTGAMEGTIEVIDGRWGASLSIEEEEEEGSAGEATDEEDDAADDADEDGDAHENERPRLLLFDLWNDPYCLHSLHEERPDLVEKYTAYLEDMWEAHRALAQRFSRTGEVPLTAEQLRTLRSLGYIQ